MVARRILGSGAVGTRSIKLNTRTLKYGPLEILLKSSTYRRTATYHPLFNFESHHEVRKKNFDIVLVIRLLKPLEDLSGQVFIVHVGCTCGFQKRPE